MKNINIPDIGLVSIRKNKRSKSLRATFQPDGTLFVSIPYYASYKEAIKFLEREKSKIIDIKESHKKHKNKIEKFQLNQIYKTKFHSFSLELYNNNDFLLQHIDDETYKIFVPQKYDINSEEIQFYLRKIVRDIYREEAKLYIIPRTIMYAKKFGFSFNKITIKNIKSRWGSCSSKQNLNFNLNLMRLPNELIDYVILHELAHLKEQNHSSNFWNFLETMVTDARKIDKKMKQYSLRHFAT